MCPLALLNKISGSQGSVQEAISIHTYTRLQRKENPNFFPSKILSTSVPGQITWNTPSWELPAPKPHLKWELTSL